jgi:Asp-tRNA(Asn)/Glu-tRNA(Gln) amidotransferase C subunit
MAAAEMDIKHVAHLARLRNAPAKANGLFIVPKIVE